MKKMMKLEDAVPKRAVRDTSLAFSRESKIKRCIPSQLSDGDQPLYDCTEGRNCYETLIISIMIPLMLG